MKKIELRPIVGYEKHYLVSNIGEVYSIKYDKMRKLKLHKAAHGYLHFHACVNGENKSLSVARAVGRAFPEICGDWFEGCTVDHINGVKDDNRAENIRVVTLKENINNPLTIAKMRLNRTDEERAQIKKDRKHQDYIKHKDYYNNYSKNYYQKNKEYYKDYYKKHPLTEEQKEKYRQRALKYYYDKKKAG